MASASHSSGGREVLFYLKLRKADFRLYHLYRLVIYVFLGLDYFFPRSIYLAKLCRRDDSEEIKNDSPRILIHL